MTDESPVKTATGQTLRKLGVMVAGAAAVAVFVAPMLMRWVKISLTMALLVAGVALAYFGKDGGWLQTMGQGAAVVAVFGIAIPYLSQVFRGVVPGGGDAEGQRGRGTKPAAPGGSILLARARTAAA